MGLHGVLGGANKSFDPQVLLDPFEKQFDASSLLVDGANRGRGKGHVIREEHEALAGLRIFEGDAAERLRISARYVVTIRKGPLSGGGEEEDFGWSPYGVVAGWSGRITTKLRPIFRGPAIWS